MNKRYLSCKRFVQVIFYSLIGLCFSITAIGQNILPSNLSDTSQLRVFLDSIFVEQMEKTHIPGAVVSIVKDGEILFTKGYGYANLEMKTPIIPDKTIFRIGSITKVFTATAVMQLADRKKIKMSDNVNKYLRTFNVPHTYPQPVTFANLLTHSAGFDEISAGRTTTSPDRVIPLGEFLKTRLIRISPPGSISSYSTYGITLGGYLVELISGIPFTEYLNANIFKPLGMDRTSITTIPGHLKSDLATGYDYSKENGYHPLDFIWFHTYPASDINSTATDMARFMIAHLEGGKNANGQILSKEKENQMLNQQFTNHPSVPGWTYGFQESRKLNNQKGLEHGGSMDDGYSSLIYLVPEHRLGIFIACSRETVRLHDVLKEAFMNRYFPLQNKPIIATPIKELNKDLDRFAGKYRWDIYCRSCNDSNVFRPQPFTITANTSDGNLSFWGGKWIQIKPLVFQLADGMWAGQVNIAFRENKTGMITNMFLGGPWVYEKIQEIGK